jgi:hypothetical protein
VGIGFENMEIIDCGYEEIRDTRELFSCAIEDDDWFFTTQRRQLLKITSRPRGFLVRRITMKI